MLKKPYIKIFFSCRIYVVEGRREGGEARRMGGGKDGRREGWRRGQGGSREERRVGGAKGGGEEERDDALISILDNEYPHKCSR